MTPVVFRKFRNGDVIALFPQEYGLFGQCVSYMHIGQHSLVEYPLVVRRTKPAIAEEREQLWQELHRIGYADLVVYSRKPSRRIK